MDVVGLDVALAIEEHYAEQRFVNLLYSVSPKSVPVLVALKETQISYPVPKFEMSSANRFWRTGPGYRKSLEICFHG
jgi:hypothetical protein